ncbi:suppressor of fused domain protein [Hahella sp. CCB-MM4]|uniref:suppressor of fused domain protein n=1 Tax=Hahella sp. (strain CCB-MM4) TaxID=1926491 RepID=UPI000B9B25C4|nr:suppressor of fused domain protein [Hahella sp. CCB-MM4]
MPEAFEIIEADPILVFVWLIPIYPEEQKFIREIGWSSFEELINDQQPDFFDLNRARV